MMNEENESKPDPLSSPPLTSSGVESAQSPDSETTSVIPQANGHNVKRPRVWSALVVALVGILAAIAVSFASLPVAARALGIASQEDASKLADVTKLLEALLAHPLGIWFLVAPGQLAFIAVAFLAAALSPEAIPNRLAMRVGRLPLSNWLILAVATPAVGIISAILVMQFAEEPSPHMELIGDLLTSKTGFGLVAMVLLVSVLPGIAEELLFRGYLQSRLLKSWPPFAAIVVSAALFAAAHGDPMHAVAVFPIGIWLGIVAWRTGSLWPAILCHAYNNLNAIVAAQLGVEGEEVAAAQVVPFVVSLVAMSFAIGILLRANGNSRGDDLVAELVVDDQQ